MSVASPQPTPWVVLLSGPTSSGKTSLARSLQRRLSTPERPFLHVEADELGMPRVPENWRDEMERRRFGRAFQRSVIAYAKEGYDIIVDGILPYGDREAVLEALDLFRLHRLCYVGVFCDLKILEQRVARRPNRDTRLVRQQHADLHESQEYHVEVDTTSITPDQAAEAVARYIEENQS